MNENQFLKEIINRFNILFLQLTQMHKPVNRCLQHHLVFRPILFEEALATDVAKTLDTIKMMGFTEIEGGRNRMTPEEFKKLCDERGISIPSTGAVMNNW